MKKLFLGIVSILLVGVSCNSSKESGFAIIIDPESYDQAKTEIDGYMNTVQSRGLHPILVIDRWGVPDSIRAELIRLYNDKVYPIEGCVFIGDIPIARTRDAQHFTTAFKMDQDGQFDRTEYTVASDRFYDTFELQWDYLDRDSVRPEYFYYHLRSDCPQRLRPTIYSARIMPRTNDLGNKYDKLRRYMQRVNKADEQNNPLDRMFYFSGYGYVSESVDARIDEKAEHYDHFPWMKGQQATVTYLDYKRDPFVKKRFMTELQMPEYDWAVPHHHGSPDIEHLSDMPVGSDYYEAIDWIKEYILSQVAKGKAKGRSMDQIKKSINAAYDCTFPDEWFKGEPSYNFEKERNLYYSDFKDFHPQVRMVTLDGCYNGSFHQDESIQERYLFGEGNGTLVVMGNTVNVLQNKWVCHFMGIVGLGARVGNMAKYGAYLEAHLFGDPTFSFTPGAFCEFDINKALLSDDPRFWKTQLKNELPAVQIIAMDKLANSGENYSDLIFDKFCTSTSGIVRLAALEELKKYRDDNYINALVLGMNDAHEMTQRFAVIQAGDCGDSRVIEPLVKLYCANTLPERVEYSIQGSIQILDSTLVMKAFDEYFPTLTFYNNADSVYKAKRKALYRMCTRQINNVESTVFDTDEELYDRKMALRTTRNYNYHILVPRELEYLSNPDDVTLQTIMWEALGWYVTSYQAPKIAEVALKVASDDRFDLKVRDEALKTYNRLK